MTMDTGKLAAWGDPWLVVATLQAREATRDAVDTWEQAVDTARARMQKAQDIVTDPAIVEQIEDEGKRPLTAAERQLAEFYFGDSIDLDRVRVNESSAMVQVNGHFNNGPRPFVLGNTINLVEGLDLANLEDRELFVHEMTHVWQFQASRGAGYLGGISDEDYNLNNPGDGAKLLDPNASINDFGIEEQGEIVAGHLLLTRRDELFEKQASGSLSAAEETELRELASPAANTTLGQLDANNVTAADLEHFIEEIRSTPRREGTLAELEEGADEISGEAREAVDEIWREASQGDHLNTAWELAEGSAEVGYEMLEGTVETGGELLEGLGNTSAEVLEGTAEVGWEGTKDAVGWLLGR